MQRSRPHLTRLALASALTFTALTTAALGAQDDTPDATGAGAPADLSVPEGPVRLRGLNGYAVLDRQHLVLRAGASRRYLVTLQRRCFGLRSGHRLGISLRDHSTVHNPHFEYVQTEDGRCYFDTIEEVESNDAARALIAARAEAESDADSRR